MKYFFVTTFLAIALCLNLAPLQVLAQEGSTNYTLLAPLPLNGAGGGDINVTTASDYIQGMFTLIIGIAGVLAVVMIIFGGIKYMSTDAFEGKSEAKGTIQNALVGLLLAIGAWLILFTINPDLVRFNLSIERQQVPPSSSGVGGGGGGGGGGASSGSCTDCVTVSVQHRPPPNGCRPVAPVTTCSVSTALNQRLVQLQSSTNFLVTESYPPTRSHLNACHSNGTCVDATIGRNPSPQNIAGFVNNARNSNLTAHFETTSEARAQAIRSATGLPASQVYYQPGITGEHFSVYMN